MVTWRLRSSWDLLFNHSSLPETSAVCNVASTGHGTQDATKCSIPQGVRPKGTGPEMKWENATECVGFPGGGKGVPQEQRKGPSGYRLLRGVTPELALWTGRGGGRYGRWSSTFNTHRKRKSGTSVHLWRKPGSHLNKNVEPAQKAPLEVSDLGGHRRMSVEVG